MPPGSAQGSARVAFEIAPYGKALDTIFATCGEATAYAQAAPGPAAMPLAASAAPARPSERPWKPARATSSGRTNLRAGPALDAAVVGQLDPGAVIQVQATGGKWWRVRATSEGRPVEGYIRQDRIRFK